MSANAIPLANFAKDLIFANGLRSLSLRVANSLSSFRSLRNSDGSSPAIPFSMESFFVSILLRKALNSPNVYNAKQSLNCGDLERYLLINMPARTAWALPGLSLSQVYARYRRSTLSLSVGGPMHKDRKSVV